MSLFPWRCFLPSRLAKRRTLPTARASRFLEAERSSRQTRLPRAANKRSLRSRIAACLPNRSEEHTSELQSRLHLVCRLLLEKKTTISTYPPQFRTLAGAPRAARVKALIAATTRPIFRELSVPAATYPTTAICLDATATHGRP